MNGTVTASDGALLKDYTVVIFSDEPEHWRLPMSRYVTGTRPDQEGRFQVKNLPAGSYYAVAVDYIAAGRVGRPGGARPPEGQGQALHARRGRDEDARPEAVDLSRQASPPGAALTLGAASLRDPTRAHSRSRRTSDRFYSSSRASASSSSSAPGPVAAYEVRDAERSRRSGRTTATCSRRSGSPRSSCRYSISSLIPTQAMMMNAPSTSAG